MAKKRTGLGRGIGALIPQAPGNTGRPMDVFFNNTPSSSGIATPADEELAASAFVKSDANDAAQEQQKASAVQSEQEPQGTRDAETNEREVAEEREAAESGRADAEEQLQQVPGATLTELQIHEITPNRQQPRHEFDEDALQELTHSIREFGVFQPIVVREISDGNAPEGVKYELIMGERRLRASKRAGKATIPAIIRGTEDEHMLRDALLENLHRAELNPLEEASAYQQLMADFGITQEQLAERIGRSRPQISNTVRLLRLPEEVQSRVAAGVLSAGHARAVLSLDGDPDAMKSLADKIVRQGLSVREAEAAAHGEHAKKPQRAKLRSGGRQGQLDEIAERLGDRLNTRVKVALGAKKGQIVIDFATISDLNRILEELDDPGFH